MSAWISDCGRYRYSLERWIPAVRGGLVLFIGVNPSTADANIDDATVRKWCGFAGRWGFGHVSVGNLFAWRATDVRELGLAEDPNGPENDDALRTMIGHASLVVPCWGSRDKLPPRLHKRIDEVRALLAQSEKPIKTLGFTVSGDPKHPLMLSYTTPLVDWA